MKPSLLLLATLLPAPLAAIASGEPLIYQSSPDMAQEYQAQATAGALELAGDSSIKPENAPSLKITTRDATGYVRSGRFKLEGNRESNFGAVYASARFFVKTSADFRGSYEVRLFVPDAKTPANSFSVPLRHFKPHAEDGSAVNGFQLTHKELCVISTANPNQLWKGTIAGEGCEVRVCLERASGTLWLSDVAIGRARPAWSKESWEQFEQAAGQQIMLSQGNLIQPMYERSLDHASPAVMDTVHKLLRVAGLNAVSEWIGWGDDFGRHGFDEIFRLEACNAPTPGGGNADYGPSLEQLAAYVDNAHYYGLQVGIMLQGTPDWTHPGRYNRRTPHSDFKDPLHNPGHTTNGLPDPYPGPQVFKFGENQKVVTGADYCQYPPDHWSDWEDLARALVTRLNGKVLYYETGNEIDCHDQGRPVGGYVTALEFLRRFHDIAHRIDPQAAVVSPDASWSQMLPAMIANGLANHCDWVGFHSYHKTESYERVRRVVEAGGVRKHLFATEGPMLREAWIGKLRGQSLWTACSLLPDDPKLPCQYFVYLKNAQGKRAVAADPRGSGDRVDWKDGLYDWGCASGNLERGNFDGASKPNRIQITVPARVTVNVSGKATIVLTATNQSSKTYTNVRLWPIGFVDALGFDRESLRASDRTIPAFRPGQTETLQMQVKPRSSGPFPGRGIYRIGLAVINDEGKYSLAAGDLEVAAAGSNK